MKCKNCDKNIESGCVVVLHRISQKGGIREWICDECFTTNMELFETKPHYIHSESCPGYCDYACNGKAGFAIAEQIHKYLRFPHDGKTLLFINER